MDHNDEPFIPLAPALKLNKKDFARMRMSEIVVHLQHVGERAKVESMLHWIPRRMRERVRKDVYPQCTQSNELLSPSDKAGQGGGLSMHAMSMVELREMTAEMKASECMRFLMTLNYRVRRFIIGSNAELRMKVQEAFSLEAAQRQDDMKRAARSHLRKNVHIDHCWKEAGFSAYDQVKELSPSGYKPENFKGKSLIMKIHGTDSLCTDPNLMHPVLRVHMVNAKTGKYLPKPLPKDSVVTYYDGEEGSFTGHIIPLQTQPAAVRGKRTVTPFWNEELVFNAEVGYLVHPDVLVLFEVLDFGPHVQAEKLQKDGWYRVAWGATRFVGSNHQTRLKEARIGADCHVRVQLHQYNVQTFPNGSDTPEVFQLWELDKEAKVKYPATLYVGFDAERVPDEKAVIRSSVEDPALFLPTLREVGLQSFQEMVERGAVGHAEDDFDEELDAADRRYRAPLDACVLPKTPFRALEAGTKGCMVMCFSKSGLSGQGGVLAAACCGRERHMINIYSVNTAKLLFTYSCHLSLIYDISFNTDDTMLVTASGDGTAKVWDMHWLHRAKVEPPHHDTAYATLAHPAYVYSAKFHPTSRKPRHLVITGGYDKLLRLWDAQSQSVLKTIRAHESHINSILCSTDGVRMYTAGGTGWVIVWRFNDTERPVEHLDDKYRMAMDLKTEIGEYPITSLRAHPMGQCVLVQGKDNKVRAIEASEPYHVVQGYSGLTSYKHNVKSTYSPDGRWIVSGSEDGRLYFWNAKTGGIDTEKMSQFPTLAVPVYDVAWHPSQHMLAITSYGRGQRIFIYTTEQDPSEAVPLELDDVEKGKISMGARVLTKDGATLNDEHAEAFYNDYMNKIYQESEALFGEKREERILGVTANFTEA